jgi:hypothetical protein
LENPNEHFRELSDGISNLPDGPLRHVLDTALHYTTCLNPDLEEEQRIFNSVAYLLMDASLAQEEHHARRWQLPLLTEEEVNLIIGVLEFDMHTAEDIVLINKLRQEKKYVD